MNLIIHSVSPHQIAESRIDATPTTSYAKAVNVVGIRAAAAFPGKRTGSDLTAGEVGLITFPLCSYYLLETAAENITAA